jgi:hypothetical protein
VGKATELTELMEDYLRSSYEPGLDADEVEDPLWPGGSV